MANNKEATLLLKIKAMGEEVLDRVSSAFDNLKVIGVAAFAAIATTVTLAIKSYREQEEATNSLTRAMVNNGIFSRELKNQYLEQAAALQKVTQFGDEQIIGAQATLQAYLGQTKVSKELIQATLDLATAKKMDLSSAAELVGKTIGTETNALARNGVEVAANTSKQERMAQVIAGIEGKWRGQAEAAASGLGVLVQLQNVFSDLLETLGQRLAPVITLFATKIKAFGEDTATTTNLVDGFVAVLKVLTDVAVIVGGVFEAAGAIIGSNFAHAIEAVSAAMKGNFSQALDITKSGMSSVGDITTQTYQKTKDRLNEIDQAYLEGYSENLAQEEALITESNARKKEAQQIARDEENAKILEDKIAQDEAELQLAQAGIERREATLAALKTQAIEKELAQTTDKHKRAELLKQLHEAKMTQIEMANDEQRVKNRADTLNTIATLQRSNNQTLATIGKAAAITQIAIETPVAIAKALSAFPPPFNFAAAGLVGAAMAAQAAQIAGVQLAEGGIVMPRPGGIQATIGEGGQAEAVIPLDRAGEFGMGGGSNITLIVNGGMLGTETEAREFALVLDRELLKLRQNNESVSHDTGVI